MGPLTVDPGPGSDVNTCFGYGLCPNIGEKKNKVSIGKEESLCVRSQGWEVQTQALPRAREGPWMEILGEPRQGGLERGAREQGGGQLGQGPSRLL